MKNLKNEKWKKFWKMFWNSKVWIICNIDFWKNLINIENWRCVVSLTKFFRTAFSDVLERLETMENIYDE